MKQAHLGQAIRSLASQLYRQGEEEDREEGGMGILGDEEFTGAIIAALQSIFEESKAWRFSGVPINAQGEKVSLWEGEGEPRAEDRFAIEIEGNLYTSSGDASEAIIAQDMIDFFMVGKGGEDGDPLPPGWTLEFSKTPLEKNQSYFYQDTFEEFVKSFPEAWSNMEHAQLQEDVPAVGPKRASSRL